MAPWCHVQSAKVVRRPPRIGSKNPYSYRYLGKNTASQRTGQTSQPSLQNEAPFEVCFFQVGPAGTPQLLPCSGRNLRAMTKVQLLRGRVAQIVQVAQMRPLLLCQLQIQLANVCVPWSWCCSHHLAHLYLFPLAPLQLHIRNAQGEDCRLGLLDMWSNVDLRDSLGVFVPAKWTVDGNDMQWFHQFHLNFV